MLKQRMIGALVVTGLAIILIPLLFDGDEGERIRMTRRIPPPPEIQLEPFDAAELLTEMERIERESESRLPVRHESALVDSGDVDPTSLSLDSDGLPVAWSLQIGSFKTEENAVRLRDQLRDEGYQSYMTVVDTDEGPTSRVLVGPMLQRSRLEDIQEQVERKFDLSGRVIRYDTVDDREMVGG